MNCTKQIAAILTLLILPHGALLADDTPQQAAVRARTDEFFARYAAKDLEGFMALWSKASDGYDFRQNAMKNIFAETGPITAKIVTFYQVEVTDDTAVVELKVDISGNDAATGEPYGAFGVVNRRLGFVRQKGLWLVTEYRPVEADWTGQLIAATPDERRQLFERRPEFVSAGVFWDVTSDFQELIQQTELVRAEAIVDLMFDLAERLKLPRERAWCWLARGQIELTEEKIDQAEESFAKVLEIVKGNRSEQLLLETLIAGVWMERRDFDRALAAYRRVIDRLGPSTEKPEQYLLANAWRNIGKSLWEQDKPEEAIEALQIGLPFHEADGDPNMLCEIHNLLGMILNEIKNYDDALIHIDRAIALSVEAKDPVLEQQARRERGRALHASRKDQEAIVEYQTSIRLGSFPGKAGNLFISMNLLAELYIEIDRLDKANALVDEMIPFMESLLKTDPTFLGSGLEVSLRYLLGRRLTALMRAKEAMTQLDRSLAVATTLNDELSQGFAIQAQGEALQRLEGHAQALQAYERAGAIFSKLNQDKAEAETILQRGKIEVILMHYEQARRLVQSAYDLLANYDDTQIRQLDALMILGTISTSLGDGAVALQDAQRYLLAAEQFGRPRDVGWALQHVADALKLLGRYDEARTTCDKAINLARQHAFPSDELDGLERLAQLSEAEAAFDRAADEFAQALQLARKLDKRGKQVSLLTNIGTIHWRRGEHEAALKSVQDAERVAKKLDGEYLTKAGLEILKISVLMMQGRLDEGIEVALALAKFERQHDLPIRTGLMMAGFLYEQKSEFAKAESTYHNLHRQGTQLKVPSIVAQSQLGLGRIANQRHQYPRALAELQQADDLAQQTGDRILQTRIAMHLGAALIGVGEIDKANQALDEGLALQKELGQFYEIVETYLAIGNAAAAVGDFQRAIEAYESALAESRRIESDEEALMLHNLGNVLLDAGESVRAEEAFSTALETFRERKNPYHETMAVLSLGRLYVVRGEYNRSEPLLEKGLEQATRLKHPGMRFKALYSLGNLMHEVGKFDRALKYFEEAGRVADELDDPLLKAMAAGQWATVQGSIGHTRQAVARLEPLIEQLQTLPVQETVITLRNQLAIVLHTAGDLPRARELFEQNLADIRKLRRPQLESGTLVNLGAVYNHMGEYADAIRTLNEALEQARRMHDVSNEAMALQNLGAVYYATGRQADAIASLEQCVQIYRETGAERAAAMTLLDLRLLYFLQFDQAALARATAETDGIISQFSRNGDRVGVNQTLLASGKLLLASGMIFQRNADMFPGQSAEETLLSAKDAFESGLKYARQEQHSGRTAELLRLLGLANYVLGNYPAALDQYNEALTTFPEAVSPADRFYGWQGIGDVHSAQQEWGHAVEAYRKSIDILEQLRTVSEEQSLQTSLFGKYLQDYDNPYHALTTCFIELGNPHDAFDSSERAKARTLVTLMMNAKVQLAGRMSPDEANRELLLQSELSTFSRQLSQLAASGQADRELHESLTSQLTEARSKFEAFQRELYLRHPELQVHRAEFAPATLREIYEAVFAGNPEACILSYVVGQRQTILFVLTAGDGEAQLEVHQIPVTVEQLTETVAALKNDYRRPGELFASDQLDQWLLEPAAKALEGKTHVVIVPDGPLLELPFHAIPDADGGYFVERVAVSYAPSITALVKMMASRPEADGDDHVELLAIGRPDFQGALIDLESTEPEVEAIAKLFPESDPPLIGRAATETAVRKRIGRARLLHFATHGLVNEDAPMYSAIALSSLDPENDARLESRELMSLTLHAEMIVLSACETALGKTLGGEGMLGLTWSVFVAGIPTSVASLWSVGDESTGELMVDFYTQLLDSRTGDEHIWRTAESLRHAQLKMIESADFDHPFYWAPFILVGDPR